MLGTNQIVGKAYFKDAKPDELLVTSRFFTLQGEGPFRGHPAYFLRLAKCNLACSFCDTYFDSGDYQSFADILQQADHEISAFFTSRNLALPDWAKAPHQKTVFVITGGEPSLQHNLIAFIAQAQKIFPTIQMESNGISVLPDLPDNITLVVSPKCLEKDGQVLRYLEPNAKMLERADCLKFVMSAPSDDRYQPYSEIPSWAHEWSRETNRPIYISPMNIYKNEPQRAKKAREQGSDLTLAERSETNEVISFWEPGLLDMMQNQRNHEYAALYCMQHGYILNLQLHLFASLP